MTKKEKEMHDLLNTLNLEEKDYSKEKLTKEEIKKLKKIMSSESNDSNENSDITIE